MFAVESKRKIQRRYYDKFAKHPEVKLLHNAQGRRRVVERSVTLWTKRLADWHAEIEELDREIGELKPIVQQIRKGERVA